MACRLPGGIDSPDQLWEALLRGDDLVTEIPPDRWDADEYYDPEPGVPGRSVSRVGRVPRRRRRLRLRVLRDQRARGDRDRSAAPLAAGNLVGGDGARRSGPGAIGRLADRCVRGIDARRLPAAGRRRATRGGAVRVHRHRFSMASGRIAYALGLHGPALTVDTACSSGLVAVHMACRSLHDGESDLALAGGATVMLEPRKFASGRRRACCRRPDAAMRSTSRRTGSCVREGCAVVLLKRLPDALRDGDRILAVLRGTAANQDGRTVNIATPSRTRRSRCTGRRWPPRAWTPRTVGMVEAHGPVPRSVTRIEYAQPGQVYGTEGPLRAGIGEDATSGIPQSAAGALGLIKAILALQHGVVPPNLHFTRLPDDLAQIETELFVPQAITPWPTNGEHRPARGGVVVRDVGNQRARHPRTGARNRCNTMAQATRSPVDAPLLFPLSSTSADELRRTAGAAGRLGGGTRGRRGVAGSGLHPGASAWAPVRADRGDGCRHPGAGRGVARGRRRRHPVSGRGRPGRPGTGVGVLRAGLAVGGDGR